MSYDGVLRPTRALLEPLLQHHEACDANRGLGTRGLTPRAHTKIGYVTIEFITELSTESAGWAGSRLECRRSGTLLGGQQHLAVLCAPDAEPAKAAAVALFRRCIDRSTPR